MHVGRIDGLYTLFAVVPGAPRHAVVVAQDPQWRRNDASVARALCADVLAHGTELKRWRCGPLSVRPELLSQGCTGSLQITLCGPRADVRVEQSLVHTVGGDALPNTSEALSAHLDAALGDVGSLGLPGPSLTVVRRQAAGPGRVGEQRAVRIATPGAMPSLWHRSTLLWRVDAERTVQLVATACCPPLSGPAVFEALHAWCAAWVLA